MRGNYELGKRDFWEQFALFCLSASIDLKHPSTVLLCKVWPSPVISVEKVDSSAQTPSLIHTHLGPLGNSTGRKPESDYFAFSCFHWYNQSILPLLEDWVTVQPEIRLVWNGSTFTLTTCLWGVFSIGAALGSLCTYSCDLLEEREQRRRGSSRPCSPWVVLTLR